MKSKLILVLTSILTMNLISMQAEESVHDFNSLPSEVKLLIFEYVAGRYDINQVNTAINTLSKVNKELRGLTLEDEKAYLINSIKNNFVKKATNVNVDFTKNKETLAFDVGGRHYEAKNNASTANAIYQHNQEVARVIESLNEAELNQLIQNVVCKLHGKSDEELADFAMSLVQSYEYAEDEDNDIMKDKIRRVAAAIFNLFSTKRGIIYSRKNFFEL
ncbi:hypothetical protein [Candidatus Babela massiliensis]|uniref:F-box domain-containing protein n=1 Tax=Candidatus Babela massiliensis TaxID=673862 RepID=V6DGA4_9BACT|nr:hypothetical protein [Candidatus Babela massiliensis]CDK30632.1 hypothetical protein BABL1_gene_383 [Candidatus Babela massiliensis]